MDATLYVIPGSHPRARRRLMLERKGIAVQARRPDAGDPQGRPARRCGFPGVTVPALKIDGRKITGLARDRARARPRSSPSRRCSPPTRAPGPRSRRPSAGATRSLQGVARRILWNAIKRDRAPLRSYSEGARLGVPIGLAVKTAAPIVAAEVRINEATDEHVRADLAALPGMLQRIDDWIAEGVLGGEQPNAADFQIATSLRLLMTHRGPAAGASSSGRPASSRLRDRPRTTRAQRRRRRSCPPAWLEPLRGAAGGRPRASARARSTRSDSLTHAAARAPRAAASRRAAPAPGRARAAARARTGARVTSRVRQRQPLGLELDVAEQQQVDVERPRAVARPAEHPPLLDLDRLADVEQRLGLELGADPRRGVEEVGLVEDLADRLGLVDGGDRLDLDPVLAEQLDRRAQVLLAVADVRAEARGSRAGSRLLACPRRRRRPRDARERTTSTADLLDRERQRRLGLGRPDPDRRRSRSAPSAARRSRGRGARACGSCARSRPGRRCRRPRRSRSCPRPGR